MHKIRSYITSYFCSNMSLYFSKDEVIIDLHEENGDNYLSDELPQRYDQTMS